MLKQQKHINNKQYACVPAPNNPNYISIHNISNAEGFTSMGGLCLFQDPFFLLVKLILIPRVSLVQLALFIVCLLCQGEKPSDVPEKPEKQEKRVSLESASGTRVFAALVSVTAAFGSHQSSTCL